VAEVGIRLLLPCLEGEQLGSVAGLQVVQAPVNLSMSGYGVVKPSVSVCRKATIWSSSLSVKPSFPTVMSILFGTSGIGQQFTFSIVPAGQCPEVTLNGINVAGIVEVYELFQALDVAIVKKLLLEVGTRGLGAATRRWHHGHVAR